MTAFVIGLCFDAVHFVPPPHLLGQPLVDLTKAVSLMMKSRTGCAVKLGRPSQWLPHEDDMPPGTATLDRVPPPDLEIW